MLRFFQAGLALAAATSVVCAQQPPAHIDLSKFPAQEIEDVVIPVPSEIFNILNKLGEPNWRSELPEKLGKKTDRRAQVAMFLGSVVADGFVAVQAQDIQRVKDIGQQVLTLADAINVRKAVLKRCQSITEKADAKKWEAVRREFDGALKDVRKSMEELGDQDLAQLVSLGGWIRGTQVLTSVVGKRYTTDGAELLNQPRLLEYFINKIDTFSSPRLKNDSYVTYVRKVLKELKPLIDGAQKGPLPKESVNKINKISRDAVNFITKR